MADNDIVVFELVSRGGSRCAECDRELHKGNFLRKEGDKGLCLDCADLGHLAYVTAGDACITRRASKYSPLRAIVLRWSRTRKHYERQGILIQEEALDRAIVECRGDAEARERRRAVDAVRRAERDALYVKAFAAEIRKRYPSAPMEAPDLIAGHACQVHSHRIGRTAGAKDFDPAAIDLAVQAHVRHCYSTYDELMAGGTDRLDARRMVRSQTDDVLSKWRGDS